MFKTIRDVYNMIVFPNAKINLGLNIINKREDGYHNLETVFYPVNVRDVLEVITAEKTSFQSTGIEIPGSTDQNLCLRAYDLISADFDLPPVAIHLHKHIPIGAGLGGGSADASFFIKLLNEKFKLGLTIPQMENYASRLGADCPFFISNVPVFATGKGDQFEELALDLRNYSLVLVMPTIHVATATAFKGIQPAVPSQSLKELIHNPVDQWKSIIFNDFEKTVIAVHPQIGMIKNALYEAGAVYASMTGSGAAIYGLFNEPTKIPALETNNRIYYV